jgi:DNA polymerase-4
MPSLPRSIAHLDMDAFFASVELLRYPQLRGQAVVVGGRRAVAPIEGDDFPHLRGYSGRGVITTATYEARALGVHSGMGLMKAAQLAPDAILLPADFDAYRHYSRLFKAAARAIAPQMEDRGIDEIYLDLSALNPDGSRDGARALALALQQAVRERHRAVVLHRRRAQQAARQALLRPRQARRHHHRRGGRHPRRIWPLPAKRINGIGPKAAARLEGLGIATIGQLAAADPAWLQAHFGSRYGQWLHDAAHGHDERPVVTESEPKACPARPPSSATSTPPRQGRTLRPLHPPVRAARRRPGAQGLPGQDHRPQAALRQLPHRHPRPDAAAPTGDARVIRRAAGECARRVPLERRIRLLGVRASALSRRDAQPGPPRPAQAELFA